MTTPIGASQPTEKPTVYRGPGAVIGGAIVLLFCLGGAVDLLVEEGTVDLVGVSVLLLVAAFGFAYGVYPAAFSGTESLVVRNPLRTITLPWGTVTKLTAQLSFIAYTATQKFTVWAVPVSLRDRRKVERARLKDRAKQHREEQRGQSRFGVGAGLGGGPRGSRYDAEAERLSYADQATVEMNARREAWQQRAGWTDGEPPAEPAADGEQPTFAWNITTIAPIVATVVFVIVAAIVR